MILVNIEAPPIFSQFFDPVADRSVVVRPIPDLNPINDPFSAACIWARKRGASLAWALRGTAGTAARRIACGDAAPPRWHCV